jgi:hypothetical protein
MVENDSTGGVLPALFRAQQRVEIFAQQLLVQDIALAALLTAYSVPDGAQQTHHRQTEEHQLALAAIRMRLVHIRHELSQVLP